MQRVLVLDHEKKPLMPCRPSRAKELLNAGRAAVFRRFPFTIIMKDRVGGDVQPVSFKSDPGSKTTGIALVADFKRGKEVIWAEELSHRGQAIRDALLSRRSLRRGRRNRKTRYRASRVLNRTRPEGWLPPSVESRIANIETWLFRARRLTPISSISMELVKFDTQKMESPEVSGVLYQQGTLLGYEVREYLLEKWDRTCAYCSIKDVPLEVEHIIPKSRGGSNRVSNLTLSCEPCNKKKSNLLIKEFLADRPEVLRRIMAHMKAPLKDAAAVNTTRWALFKQLKKTGLPVEVGTGARTKFNRTKLGYPKAHWIDAACVGESGSTVKISDVVPLEISAVGQGRRQRCLPDAFGFPRAYAKRAKTFHGWRTGDMALARIPAGTNAGTFIGRVAIRHRPCFRIGKVDVHPKYLSRLHRADGYEYHLGGAASPVA